jgi:prepilin-type processing-associated H-X9-DG protein
MSARSRVGVTFMEIVSVIAIIAVVTAVIFPVFQKMQKVREHAHSSCQGNFKQLGLAYLQYEEDNDNNFPAGVNAAGNGWAGEIYLFTKSTEVYHCPDDPSTAPFISYAENLNLVKQNQPNLPAPAATVELYEFTTPNCDPSTAETNSATGLSAPQDSKRHDQPNFRYGLNFAFADGHVKYLTPEKVSGGPNAVRAKALPQGASVGTFAVR